MLLNINLVPQQTKTHHLIRAIIIVATFLITTLHWLMNTDYSKQIDPSANTSGKKITKNPIIVWLTHTPYVQTERTVQCFRRKCNIVPACVWQGKGDAYLIYGSFFKHISVLPLPRDSKTIWGVMHEESMQAAVPLMFESVLNLFNYSLTFSRFSSTPFPLMWMGHVNRITSLEFYVNTSIKNVFTKNNASVVFVQNSCESATEREEYVAKLMEYIPVDSYGPCLQNKDWGGYGTADDFLWSKSKLEMIANYKFFITIENTVCTDYVTEKIWRALIIGVVPIYFGSPLIRDWLPNNRSAILVEDFPTPQLLSAHLYELLQNDTKYEEYLEHKTKGLITNKRLLQEVMDRPYQTDMIQAINKFHCLVCERIHDRNSSNVDTVTKKHFDCPKPLSMLTNFANPYNWFHQAVERDSDLVKHLGAYALK